MASYCIEQSLTKIAFNEIALLEYKKIYLTINKVLFEQIDHQLRTCLSKRHGFIGKSSSAPYMAAKFMHKV